jgi:PilZ domain
MINRKKRRGGVESRKSPRRTLGYPGKIDARDGTPLHACVLFDVSQTGAKLIAQTAAEIPYEFTLLLGKTFRKCRVVWKNDRQMGVRFLPLA